MVACFKCNILCFYFSLNCKQLIEQKLLRESGLIDYSEPLEDFTTATDL